MIEKVFTNLTRQYTSDDKLINKLWNEISTAYSKSNRYYHTLQHLESLLRYLEDVKHQITNWNAVLFALYYHDIVYNVLKHNNEEKSAATPVTHPHTTHSIFVMHNAGCVFVNDCGYTGHTTYAMHATYKQRTKALRDYHS